MTKLKWILRDCNIYIALLFIALSFFPSLVVYKPLLICFSVIHLFKILKMIREKIFFISNFNVIMALTCFIPLSIDYYIDSFTFSIFLVIPISLKALLFTKKSTMTLNHYLKQHNLEPDFMVVVQNELKDYLFNDSKSTLSHYFYISDVEFRLTESFKGIVFSKKFIPFADVKHYCSQHGLEYANLKRDDVYRMTMLVN